VGREIVIAIQGDQTYLSSAIKAAPTLYLYDSQSRSKLAGDAFSVNNLPSLFYTHYTVMSPSAWQLIPYSGHTTIDAKFLAGVTNKWQISGYVCDPRENFTVEARELVVLQRMKALLAYNKEMFSVSMTIAGESMLSSANGVITQIVTDHIGQGTGPRWPFTIEIADLGV
jgi:hypothetical protein